MKVNFVEDHKKDIWNEFVIKNDGSFLQSFEWGNFKKQFLQKIWRIEINNKDGKKLFEAQILKEKIFFITYFYLPYGPIFNKHSSPEEKEESFNLFLRKIEELAKKERAFFLRIEPTEFLPKIRNFLFKRALKRIQPQKTLILDLDKSENELLANIQAKTKYNIRLAQKKGVKIKISNKYLSLFYDLLKKTKKRQDFFSHSEEHYKKLFKINGKDFKVKMFLAEYQKKIIIASIVVFFGNKATFLHTASNYQYRSLKGADLLRWKIIVYSKKMGYKINNFWGIDEKKFPGVTSFKKHFGGTEIEYPLGVDVLFNNTWYQIYRILRKIKQMF